MDSRLIYKHYKTTTQQITCPAGIKRPTCQDTAITPGTSSTLLTRVSSRSKWRPYSLGASPGVASILIHTSAPLRTMSTGLWFTSKLVIIPRSMNCEINEKERERERENGESQRIVSIQRATEWKLTFFVGTVMGVPALTTPASTCTPITMGLRALNTQFGRIRSLHGNTAMCSNSLRFLSLSSWSKEVSNAQTASLIIHLCMHLNARVHACTHTHTHTHTHTLLCVWWSYQKDGIWCQQ